ncbi:MAG: hypothetical protein ABIG61_17745, partial [Planctomycetota bacterium]
MPRIPTILMLLFLMLFTNPVVAQEKDGDIEQLNTKILQLQQQMIEMQKKHDAEINALKQQVNELAGQTGKPKAKDELAALRELAQAEAAKEK